MLAFLSGLILAFAETGGAVAGDNWFSSVEPYVNYPGFEVWRFLNLAIFALIMFWLLRKPLSEAFKKKREEIRAELIKAEAEKKAATEKLDAAKAKLAGFSAEKKVLIKGAKDEAESERKRIEAETENDIRRAKAQAETELARKRAQVHVQLRRFSADESIRLAEEKLKSTINAQSDAELIKANVRAIGGVN
ncbi:MAG: hypothetical protein HKN33_06765 [Pyrinomonadaceae bacterium]|nr:hypothetical protein [Pyrinomonadaceae bacterium]